MNHMPSRVPVIFAILTVMMLPKQAATQTAEQTVAVSPVVVQNCDPEEYARMQQHLLDWPDLQRYRADNAALPAPTPGTPRVIFYGDSITDAWGRLNDTGTFFPGKDYINRGISGQTTPQMLVRFQQDVIRLHPAVVVILAGTNDVAGNTGPSTPEMIEDNYMAMTKLAQASGIKVVLASITPAFRYPWKPAVEPVQEIRALNGWIREFCATGVCTYLDYYKAMSDANGGMLPGYAKDGVHPTTKGYSVMAPLAEQAITQALSK